MVSHKWKVTNVFLAKDNNGIYETSTNMFNVMVMDYVSVNSISLLVVKVQVPTISTIQYEVVKVSKQSLVKLSGVSTEHWKEHHGSLKPCWKTPSIKWREPSNGFVLFSLTDGPEYHVSQIADAVKVARYLEATLVLPDIRGSKSGDKRKFGEIYDIEKFMRSLAGVIEVEADLPAEISRGKLTSVRVPNRVPENYIATKVAPLFKSKGNLRLATYFPSLTLVKEKETETMDPYSCLAMFESLHLQPRLQQVVGSMVGRLKIMSQKSNSQFVAVDLRVEMLAKKCQEGEAIGIKSCYNAREIGQFLKKIGFQRNTTIYLTQTPWHSSLDAMRDIYPNTFTKEEIMLAHEKANFLNSESSEFEKVIDFHLCSESDVFVPAFSSLFCANVIGKRIALGKAQVLVPAQITSPSPTDYISPYISKKNHLAYSCFC